MGVLRTVLNGISMYRTITTNSLTQITSQEPPRIAHDLDQATRSFLESIIGAAAGRPTLYIKRIL